MCKRCENSWDAVQSFCENNWSDEVHDTQEAYDAAYDNQMKYISEHCVLATYGRDYLLCGDGSIIVYDYDQGEFNKDNKSDFVYCPHCGRKLG